jgi:hypothetical protein
MASKQAILCVLTGFTALAQLVTHSAACPCLNRKEQACFTGTHFAGAILPETVGTETFPLLTAGNVCFNRPYAC